MKRVKLDSAPKAVKEFVRGLPVGGHGIELELNGHVVCKIIPPSQLSEEEKAALIKRGRELIQRARERNKGVPAKVLALEARQAVDEVRRRRQ